MAKVGLAQYGENETVIRDWQPDAEKWFVKADPLAKVSYWQEGAFRANLSVRSFNRHTYSFGAWISPELTDTLQLPVGGTVATGKLWKFNGGDGWSDRQTK